MKILNLGCGDKTSASEDVINIDWSIYHKIKTNPLLRLTVLPFLDGERRKTYDSLPTNVMAHDLKKGIPFPDNYADVVYHSHVFEHIPRQHTRTFLKEVRRVLKPGGVHRIVLPDMEELCTILLNHLKACDLDPSKKARHDNCIDDIIGQCLQEESVGTANQRGLRKFAERVLLGSARKRGQTHEWMYDRVTLGMLLEACGFEDVQVMKYNTSQVEVWNEIGLDVNADNTQYKRKSLYLESKKPAVANTASNNNQGRQAA